MYYYLLFLLILIPFLAFSAWASAKVNTTYSAFDKVPSRSCMTGYDTAVRLMRNRGVQGIEVGRVNGKLTDHYNPTKAQVNLSMSTFGSSSRASAIRSFLISPGLVSFPSIIRTGSELSRATCERTSRLSFWLRSRKRNSTDSRI